MGSKKYEELKGMAYRATNGAGASFSKDKQGNTYFEEKSSNGKYNKTAYTPPTTSKQGGGSKYQQLLDMANQATGGKGAGFYTGEDGKLYYEGQAARRSKWINSAANEYQQYVDYLTSGKYDYDTSKRLLDMAKAQYEKGSKYGADRSTRQVQDAYQQAIDILQSQVWAGNSQRKADLQTQLDAAESALKDLQNQKDAKLSAEDYIHYYDEDWKQKNGVADIDNQIAEQESLITDLKKQIGDIGINTNENREKKIEEYKKAQKEYNAIAASEQGFLPIDPDDPNSITYAEEARRKMVALRQDLDETEIQMFNGPMDYTLEDRAKDIAAGAWRGIESEASNAAGTVLAGIRESDRYRAENPSAGFLGERTGPNAPVTGREEYYEQQKEIQQQDNLMDVGAQKLQDVADSLGETAQLELARAKNNLGELGQAGVDLATNVLQMGFDVAVGSVTGGSALVPMFVRTFGDAAREARLAGADVSKQLAYGLTKGGIEVATEIIFDGVAKAYGAGAADEITEKLIQRLGKNDIGRTLLRAIAGAAGEGAEEVMSDILGTFADLIYKDETLREAWEENMENALYDFLLGAAMGGLGSVTSVVTGQNKAANEKLKMVDRAENMLMQRGYDKANARNYGWMATQKLYGEELSKADQKRYEGRPTAQAVTQQIANEDAVKTLVGKATAFEKLTDDQKAVIANGYTEGDPVEYLFGAIDAYELGKSGLTLDRAFEMKSGETTLNAVQFRHAWQLGNSASVAATAKTAAESAKLTGTDAMTEEGKATFTESLTPLFGDKAEAVAGTIQQGQDPAQVRTAMNKAAFMLAANGADVAAYANSADASDIVKSLTPEQINLAQEIGEAQRAQSQAQEQKIAEKLAADRAMMEASETYKDLRENEKALRQERANKKAEQQAYYDGLAQLQKMNREGLAGTDAYKALQEEVQRHKNNVEQIGDVINYLAENRKNLKVTPGKVIFAEEDGTAGDVEYKAVDQSKLTKTQKAALALAEKIADIAGIEVRVVDFGEGMGGEYLGDGIIYLNINAQFNGKNIAAASLTHEVTHFLKEYAPEEYALLKDVVIQEIARDPKAFSSIVSDRLSAQMNLTADELTDEMVANACMTIFQDSEAVQRIVNENRNLAEKIIDFLNDIINNIKAAFSDIDVKDNFTLYKEVRAVENQMEQIRELWLNAFNEAAENRNAQLATESEAVAQAMAENDMAAAAESETQLQKWEGEEPKQTQYGFKLMNVDENGLPHAMFIDAAAPYELNTWYKADSPKMENLLKLEPGYAYLVDSNDVADEASRKPISKVKGNFRGLPGKAAINQATAEGKRWMVVDQYANGQKSIHNVGINGSGGVSTFALRPGIHAVDIPSMAHIGAKSEGSAKIDTRRPDQRWFLIEYPVDQDYNQEAYASETKDIRDHLPERGWYSFQTNSGAEARQHWFITGGMKIVGAVSEADVRKYAQDRGFEEDLPWKNGKSYSDDDAINLDEYMRTTKAQPTPSKEEMRQRIEGNRPKMQAWKDGNTFNKRVNSIGVYVQKETIDLVSSSDSYWTGGRIYDRFSMDNVEFRQFHQTIEKLTKDMPYYGEVDNPAIEEDSFTVTNEKGKAFVYQVSLDGYMHGEILSKTDVKKNKKTAEFYRRSGKHGRSAADLSRRIEVSREESQRSNGDNGGIGESNGPAGSGGVAPGTQRGEQKRNNNGSAQVNEGQNEGVKLQAWDEGTVYNRRALVSEETLDKWLSSSWYGASNPNYAQAYITSMSPSQFLKLTTIYDEGRIRQESKGRTMEWVKDVSESQPIRLTIDTETGQIIGHEGRHRMAVLEENGVREVPVLLFDSKNKESKVPLSELQLLGEEHNGHYNISRGTVRDVYPLNKNNRGQIIDRYSKQTSLERMSEKYQGKKSAQFSMWSDAEETDKMIAVHNKTMSGLRRMINREGVPFPSVAIKKAGSGHNHYGPVSIVLPRDSIDPRVNRDNRIYGGDAWTPTEPATEYDVGDTSRYTSGLREKLGKEIFNALHGDTRLDSDYLAKRLRDSGGDIEEALKDIPILKYAYLQSIGETPKIPVREGALDGFGKYKNDQLLAVFDALTESEIDKLEYGSATAQKIADVLNEQFRKRFEEGSKAWRALSKKPLYDADDISPHIIQDAYNKYVSNGNSILPEYDYYAFERAMQNNTEVEENASYHKWLRDTFGDLVVDSGIRNNKDPYTPSGGRRSFKQLHDPATLDNIVRLMKQEPEKGVTSFAGTNLMGAGTKTYNSVEEARADIDRLYEGDYIDEEEFEGPKRELHDRLDNLVSMADTNTDTDFYTMAMSRDATRQILTEAVRDCKTKESMKRRLQKESPWINNSEELLDQLWQLAEDTRNMKVPYFEGKLRRVLRPNEALAYLVEDTAEETDADLLKKMRDMGLNVITYKAGDSADRLAKLNSVEGARFQTWGQVSMDDITNGEYSGSIHPMFLERMDAAKELNDRVKAYFDKVDPNSDWYLTQEQIDDLMELNVYARRGDMADADEILISLSNLAKEQKNKTATYELMDDVLQHLSPVNQSYWTDDRYSVKDEAFRDWYNRRHPSLYYPGYKRGDLAKDANLDKEVAYLQRLLKRNLQERDRIEAEELLAEYSKGNAYNRTFYQRWENTTDDTASERNDRELAYSRIASESAIVNDLLKDLKKQQDTIGDLEKKLQLVTNPQTREEDARKLAKQYIADYDGTADRTVIAQQIKALGDALMNGASETELKNQARAIAAQIIESAEVTEEADAERYQGIRDRIQGKKLMMRPEYFGELDGDFNSFRKKNLGKFILASSESENIDRSQYTSVDQFYTDLQAEYPEILPAPGEGAMNEGEYIKILSEVFNAGQAETVNPFENYMGEATEDLANKMLMDAVNGALRPAQGAGQFKARKDAMKQQIEALKKEQKLSDKEASHLWATVADLSEKLDKAESRYKTLQTEYDYRLTQVKAEGKARALETKYAEREKAAQDIADLKAYYHRMMQRQRENREESASFTKYRKQVEKKSNTLYEMLLKNDDKMHVPEGLKQPLGDFLESLNFTSKRQLAGGAETQADQKFGARLMRLQQVLENQQRYLEGDGQAQDLGGYIDVSPDSMQFLRDTSELITTALSQNRDFTINQMTGQQLKDLSNFMSSLTTAIRNMNNFMANARYESVREAAQQDIEHMNSLGKAGAASTTGIGKLAAWQNGTPYYILKRFGEGGKAIFDGFARGWERLAFNAQEIINFTENLYTDKEVKAWKNEVHNFTLEDGSKIQMTTGQIMGLSMLMGREQALKHIEKGGIRIGDIEQKVGKIQDTNHYHFTQADFEKILGTLTPRQNEVAKALQKYMAEKGAEWGNEISMRRFGYNFYEEGPGYYPIRTDANDRPMADTDAQQNSMFRLLNLSASKSLNPKASNALIVDDIFNVFADHMSDMAKLNGMGLPILDAIKWFNYKERVDLGDGAYDTVTTQAAMQQAFGDEAGRYFRTLMKDINGVTESGDRGTNVFTKLMSNYKIASVAANLRVALLQPTSYVRAMTVLNPKYLVGNLPSVKAYNEAMKWSGTAVWKSLGYYETDISRGLREKIQHDDTLKDKIAEASMTLAEKGDQLTWSMLWQACKRQVKANNKSLTGDGLMQATADLFREVVYSSQVMDSTLTRSEIMRGKTLATKAASAFMAEPTLSYNILADAVSKYTLDVRKNGGAGAWQRNAPAIGRAFGVYLSSAVFAALVESLADAVRDDDDDEFLDKFQEALLGKDGKWYTGNLAQDLTILGKIPYVKNVVSNLQGYKSTDMSMAAFSNIIDVLGIWKETIDLNRGVLDKATKRTYYGKMTEWGKIYKTLQAASQLSGLAASNAMRDVVAIWNTIMNGRKDEWKIRTYDNAKSEEQKIKEQLTANKITAADAAAALIGTGMKSDKAQTTVNKWLWEEEAGVQYSKLDDEYKAGKMDKEQAKAGLIAGGLTAAEADKKLADYDFDVQYGEQYEELGLTTAQAKFWVSNAKNRVTMEQYAEQVEEAGIYVVKDYYNGKNYGIRDFDDYALFRTIPFYDAKDRNKAAEAFSQTGISMEQYVKYMTTANVDNNTSVNQDELGTVLVNAINRGEIDNDTAERIWWTRWQSKNTFAKWKKKH